jgi:hypothetical protein
LFAFTFAAFAVAHIEFRHPEHKARAERARSRICYAFQMAIGCPVELQISLACMPGDQQSGFTSFEEQVQRFDDMHMEKAKVIIATPDRGSYETKASAQRRQRSIRVQQYTESMEIPQLLYNAVIGENKSEILPAGRHGEAKRSDRSRETRTYSIREQHVTRPMDTTGIQFGPALASRNNTGKMPLKTAIHQFDEGPPNHETSAHVMCGSHFHRKSSRFKHASSGQAANSERGDL